MTSMQLRPHVGLEGSPPSQQFMQLHGLGRVIVGDCFKNVDLFPHQAKVGDWVSACLLDASDVGGKRLTAQQDAQIGFAWGHGLDLGATAAVGQVRRL